MVCVEMGNRCGPKKKREEEEENRNSQSGFSFFFFFRFSSHNHVRRERKINGSNKIMAPAAHITAAWDYRDALSTSAHIEILIDFLTLWIKIEPSTNG